MTLVYVADDEPDLADMLREMLTDAGYEVDASPDGPTLLQRAGEKRPDLILLDINMPGMTGWDVKKRLEESPALAGVPVIAVTAQGGPSIETSAMLTLRFAEFVRKPFRLAELLEKVDRALAAQTDVRPSRPQS